MSPLRKLFGGKRRLVLIGLDGVPCTLLQRLAAAGVIPHLARWLADGGLKAIEAPAPEISAVSWSTFMTGADPGHHGIFGFIDLDAEHRLFFPGFAHLRQPPFWERWGERGLRSAIINLPSTYPARPTPGILVSGFVAVDLRKAVWPAGLADRLIRAGYRIDVDSRRAKDDLPGLLVDLRETLLKRFEIAAELFREEKWDFFMLTVTGTDRLHHFLWHALEDPSHPHHADFLDFYRALDGQLGMFMDLLDSRQQLYMMSDHGFTGIRQEVFLNRLLRERGYLAVRRDPPQSHQDLDVSVTRAFCLDPGRIYINRCDRFRQGIVTERDAPVLREELRQLFDELRHDGRPVLREVLEREAVYTGPHARLGPDLVLVPHDGYDLKGSLQAARLFDRSHRTGMHTRHDAFFFGEDPDGCVRRVEDVAGLLGRRLGLGD